MANGILDELKRATQQVQEIAKMEAEQRSQYETEVAKQFFELQKTVHSIISEEGIILKNFKWKVVEEFNRNPFNIFIERKATLFANAYGFSKETVLSMLETKNNGLYKVEFYGFKYYMLVPKE